MQIPECVVNCFYSDTYNKYRNEIVSNVHYEDDGMYVSDGDYMSEDEFVKEIDLNEIYNHIYEIQVSDDTLITDLKYYFDDMMFKNNDTWYVYATEFYTFFHDVVIRAAIKFISGFIKLGSDNIFKWNNGMIVDESTPNFSFDIRPCVHDSEHFRENVSVMYEKKDNADILDDLYMMVEHKIYERNIPDLNWIMDLFPDLLECIYVFDYMCYLIYYDDIELFEMLLPIVKTYDNYTNMLKTAIKYDRQGFFTLLLNDDKECITKDIREILEKYNKMSWLRYPNS